MRIHKSGWQFVLPAIMILVSAFPLAGSASEPTTTGDAGEVSDWSQGTDGAVLYDQMDFPGGLATASQNFAPADDAFDCFLGDDFVVPVGGWIIDLVEVDGVYFSGTGPAASVNVWFYSNSGANLPDAAVYTALNLPYAPGPGAGDFVITLSPPPCLLAGTFWLVVQPNMDFNPGGQWGWQNRSVTSNAGAAWQNPGGGFLTACNSWGRRATTCNIDPNNPDQNFRLSGAVGCATPVEPATWGSIKALYP